MHVKNALGIISWRDAGLWASPSGLHLLLLVLDLLVRPRELRHCNRATLEWTDAATFHVQLDGVGY